MSEIIHEATPVEKAALAIKALTYGEMIELAAGLRDILSDRLSDGNEISDARTLADAVHSWAEAQLFCDEGQPSDV